MSIESHKHSYTREIVCPYCGEEQGDSWEYCTDTRPGDVFDIQCGKCEKEFSALYEVETTFTSYPKGKE